MRARYGMTRRQAMLSGAAGGVAFAAGGWRASAQPAKRIERLAPELDAIIATS